MSTANSGGDRRADLLDRLQETGDRHDAAELERASVGTNRGAEELLRQAGQELRVVAAELRQMIAEIRQGVAELLAELRDSRRR